MFFLFIFLCLYFFHLLCPLAVDTTLTQHSSFSFLAKSGSVKAIQFSRNKSTTITATRVAETVATSARSGRTAGLATLCQIAIVVV
ncbi:hypothetical protein F5H01DRAFT_357569 [Linnemannia elongata]|nr:hypothetical protein F5H01DRAFT_357569 [Linnemannia elongata]